MDLEAPTGVRGVRWLVGGVRAPVRAAHAAPRLLSWWLHGAETDRGARALLALALMRWRYPPHFDTLLSITPLLGIALCQAPRDEKPNNLHQIEKFCLHAEC